MLAVFTFAVASSVTIGGIIYDASGWKGMSVFHTICQVGSVRVNCSGFLKLDS